MVYHRMLRVVPAIALLGLTNCAGFDGSGGPPLRGDGVLFKTTSWGSDAVVLVDVLDLEEIIDVPMSIASSGAYYVSAAPLLIGYPADRFLFHFSLRDGSDGTLIFPAVYPNPYGTPFPGVVDLDSWQSARFAYAGGCANGDFLYLDRATDFLIRFEGTDADANRMLMEVHIRPSCDISPDPDYCRAECPGFSEIDAMPTPDGAPDIDAGPWDATVCSPPCTVGEDAGS